MNVLIDGRPLQTPSVFRGIGRYVNHIVRAFGQDARCNFLFFRGNDAPAGIDGKVFTSSPRRLITLSDSFFLSTLFQQNRISIYHSTAYALPRRVRDVRYLLTVYDLTLLKFPRGSSWRHRQVFRRIIESAKRADLVLPISEKTATDLNEFARIDPDKMRIIRPMLDERILPAHAEKPAATLPGEYLLYVGGADPTKNLATLLQAVSHLRIPLAIAGRVAEKRIAALLSPLPAADHRLILFLGHVPDSHLAWLYQHAAAFVFPSLNEGFGYPPLEALQCGTPAIVSRAGSLPEILEDAAVFVDAPLETEEWCTRIRLLLESPTLRGELLARGQKILPMYSRDAFVNSMARIYFPEK